MCKQCIKNPVYIDLSGKLLCKNHFIKLYEKKIKKAIRKYNMLDKDLRKERIIVATSGGKDSTALLHFLQKYCKERDSRNLMALAVDEGIAGYRDKTLKELKDYCKKNKIPLTIISFKAEFGFNLDEAVKIIKKKKLKLNACFVCGVLRRYLINKYALKLKATKLATAHCLNDEAQTIITNFLKGSPELLARAGPISGIMPRTGFVQRVKPLYFCTEKENMLYCLLNNIKISFNECKYLESYRLYVRNFLNNFEKNHPGCMHAIVNTFLAIEPLIKQKYKNNDLLKCDSCGFPSARNLCKACEIIKIIKAK